MSRPLRSVTVVGGGIVALVAATAFARALPRARVVLVPAPVAPDDLADRWPATLPSSAALFETLGIERAAWIGTGFATERLAARIDNWSRDGTPWWIGDGSLAVGPPGVALSQLWWRAGGPDAMPLDALCPAALLAQSGRRWTPAADAASPWSTVEPALALDPTRGGVVAAAARACRVTSAAPLAGVERDGDQIVAVRLVDGGRLDGDLFVDASGSAAALTRIVAPAFHDWSAFLPSDRLLLGVSPTPAHDIDRYKAVEQGWIGDWGGTRLFAHASAVTSERQAARVMPAAAETVRIAPGRRLAPWTGNCLALGEAAAQPGPLLRTGFALALAQLALALALLPAADMEPLLIAEYNRRANQRADRLRDWLAAMYLAGGRRRGAFWQGLTGVQPPPGLATTLQQVARRGHVPAIDDDIVARDAWAAVLFGQGIRPALIDPVARGIDPAAARTAIRAMADDLASQVAALPSIGRVR